MAKEKIDQVLEEITLLKEGQQRNYDLIQKNGIKIEQVASDVKTVAEGQQRNYDLIQKNGIKIEQVASDVKVVAEGHRVIRSEMRQMKEELRGEIAENRSAIKFVANKVNDIDSKLAEHIRQPTHI